VFKEVKQLRVIVHLSLQYSHLLHVIYCFCSHSACGVIVSVLFLTGSVVTVIEISTGTTVFFSNIEPYWNRSFVLSVDGFGFLISIWRSSSVLTVVNVKQHAAAKQPWRSDCLACFSGSRRYYLDQTETACGAASSIWEGGGGLERLNEGA